MKYEGSIAATLLIAGMSTSFVANAQICAKPSIVQDGCTFPVVGVITDAAKPFKDLWRNQCNKHDVNYQTLGKSKQASDSELYADMRARCDSKFNKYLMYSLNRTCRTAASGVYNILKNVDSSKYYLPNQRKIENATQSYVNNINADQCDMTPEYAGVYDPSLLSYINTTFYSIARRQPTAYERFELLSFYDPDTSLSAWQSAVRSQSTQMARLSGPKAVVRNENSRNQYVKSASASTGSNLRYEWDLNYGQQSGVKYTKSFMTRYNETKTIYGSLKVTDSNGRSDLLIINDRFTTTGECAPSPKLECY
ncbi:hypothetical protein [Pseudoalteromonas sp. T1lg23B]|uniref:hypothetical protein n=1 Tax=Pseudoalteromonas sp. T1lg23B TaxID=2077097 RepID=UPI000CF6FEB4|nr:hypothetical protein [Pseudoalteromonas sp. T1lg23B]